MADGAESLLKAPEVETSSQVDAALTELGLEAEGMPTLSGPDKGGGEVVVTGSAAAYLVSDPPLSNSKGDSKGGGSEGGGGPGLKLRLGQQEKHIVTESRHDGTSPASPASPNTAAAAASSSSQGTPEHGSSIFCEPLCCLCCCGGGCCYGGVIELVNDSVKLKSFCVLLLMNILMQVRPPVFCLSFNFELFLRSNSFCLLALKNNCLLALPLCWPSTTLA